MVVRIALERQGYRIMEAVDGKSGLDLALAERPDLVVLDIDMPALTGIEVCQELRRLHFDAPILMLTGRTLLDDKVTGLNAGADDYLAKPFESREFLARVQALLRRHQRATERPAILVFDQLVIDLRRRVARLAGEPVEFTKTEFAILELLARTPGRPVSRETLLDIVWGYTRFPNTRTVDTHVWRLRKKIGDAGEEPRWIKRVHGQGYLLSEDAVATQE
jgi:Response regulators consisting of a CheY-like receiver domain and a winged-helix DNA-binding domain